MRVRASLLFLATVLNGASRAGAQAAAKDTLSSFPRTVAAIGDWDAAIVRRAAALIASPTQWSRSDTSACRPDASAVSIRCALERAIAEAAAQSAANPATPAASSPALPVDCQLTNIRGRAEGTCGVLFDEPTVFAIARVKAITTGAWRSDAAPREVWGGQTIAAEAPVLQQARRLVDAIAPEKYRRARLVEFNDDSLVTYSDLQNFFRVLEQRVRKLTAADLESAAEDVEIELYTDGAGVIRTYNGWYAVRSFSAKSSSVRFQMDTSEIRPNALDREIVTRANALLSSDAVWNRSDNRKCDPAAKTWSIYCALEHATREVTGGFHHRRPALEIVRVIIEERTKDRDYSHRLMDYNNDTTTHLDDVRTLFDAALKRMK
jgi:hypothetical protein